MYTLILYIAYISNRSHCIMLNDITLIIYHIACQTMNNSDVYQFFYNYLSWFYVCKDALILNLILI